jgi:thioredoxin reductase (NADPH)
LLIYDSIIIGAGPAGIVAAIQLKRSGRDILIFEKDKVGGLLRNANLVENYVGVGDGMIGKDLVEVFEKKLKEQEINVLAEEVIDIKKDEVFEIKTNQNVYKSKTVIVATGTIPKKLDIAGVGDLEKEEKIFYEVKDIFDQKNIKKVIVIGGGDAGFDYSINLNNRGFEPEIVTRGDFSCLPLLLKRAKESGISMHKNQKIKEIKKHDEEIKVVTNKKSFNADAILVAIGREPSIPIEIEEQEGLYIVGDAKGGKHRQVHIATGDALNAAMDIVALY